MLELVAYRRAALDNIENEQSNLHWMLQMLQTIEVGLMVLDKNNRIHLWNSFMENHSGVRVATARNRNLFELFPDLPQAWLERKINAVFKLKSRAYSTWEQRPHLFRFQSVRPLTSQAPLMYQNLTLSPLIGADGEVSHVCVLVYDVTDVATNRLSLEEANKDLATLSQTDRLSGLANRGYWEDCLAQEYQRLQRYQGTASLVLFDIDHFKKVNDTYGHHVGDEVIKQIAQLTSSGLRDTDKAGRYGGEEFALLLPHTTVEQAHVMAERLRETIANHTFNYEDTQLSLTISSGIAEFQADFESYTKWIEAADQALYKSKRNGRNQSSIAPYDV